MGTGLRGRGLAARALLALAGLLAGMMVLALPSAEAAAAPEAGRSAIPTAPSAVIGPGRGRGQAYPRNRDPSLAPHHSMAS